MGSTSTSQHLLLLPIIIFLLQLHSTACDNTPNATSSSTKSRASSRPIFLIVSFDGFRHSYLDPSRTPILSNLASTGATVPYMIPAFPTKTFPNHQSIATGLYTESHGIIDNIVYDPNYEETLDGKKNGQRFWNYRDDVLPLWIRNEQQGGVSGCLMWPGSNQGYGKYNNLKPTYYYDGYSSSVTFESRVSTVISWMTDSRKPANLVYLYYHQPDGAGHTYGPHSPNTIEQVKQTDKRVGYLLEKLKSAGIYDRVNLVLLSDHGMKTVRTDKKIDISKLVDRERLVRDTNGANGTPLLQVIPRSGRSDELYNSLERASRTRSFSVFKKSQLCGEPYFYCRSRRIHDYVTLADPGWTLTDSSSRRVSRSTSEYGSHGYVNTAESMRVIFIAKGPAFKRGFKTSQPIKNVDVVPLISKVMGLVNVPNNGSLSRADGMLR